MKITTPRTVPTWIGVLFMAIFLSSCCGYQEVQFVSVDNVELEEFSADKIKVKVTATVDNPNCYKIKIVNSDLDLFIGGNNIGKASIDQKIVLPKNSKGPQTVVISTDVKKAASLLGGGLSMLFGGSVNFRCKGTVKARAFFIGKKFPVDFKERVAMPHN